MKNYLTSKLHNALVTESRVEYMGSIEIDEDYMDSVGLEEYQKVLVASTTTGARLETYVIKGPRGSKTIGLNGAAAHLIAVDERVIIMGFSILEQGVEPQVEIFH